MFHSCKQTKHQSGSAMVELLIVCPTLLFLGLGTVQIGLIYHAKSILNYATFEAARVGAVHHAQVDKMREELGLRMAPVYGGDGTQKKAAMSILRAKTAANDTSVTKISLLSPNETAFDEFGVLKTVDGVTVKTIPNSHLRYRDRALSPSGQTIQQANLLTIKVTYGVRLRLPVLDMPVPAWEPTMRFIMTKLDPQRAHYYSRGLLPITAKATVRMQSEAHLDTAAYQVDRTSDPNVASVPFYKGDEPGLSDYSMEIPKAQGSDNERSQEGAGGTLAKPSMPSDRATMDTQSPSVGECSKTLNGLPEKLSVQEYLGTNPLSCWTPAQTQGPSVLSTPIESGGSEQQAGSC